MNLLYKYSLALTMFFCCIACSKSQKKSTSIPTKLLEIDTNWNKKIIQSDEYWKEHLSKEIYYVARQKGTERPFSSTLYENKTTGIYICSSCKNPLFSSSTKFNSGTGWPSFWQAFSQKSTDISTDESHGMTRDEVTCSRCDAHLGHVFNDGPKPTGLRYCINGVSLNFVPEVKTETVLFAQGCFWCLEEIFEKIKGVSKVVSGYAGGNEDNPTYEKVGSGNTNHAEAILVTYDPNQITFQELLKVYFHSGDITQVNGQGPDKGKQYRSILFYKNDEEKKIIESSISDLDNSKIYTNKVSIEVIKETKFYEAEEYHQDFVKLNPTQGYVVGVSIPRYQKAIKHFPELLKVDSK